MAQPTVVVSGAGIAGPALAHWLSAADYRVVVVELADGIRPGGQTVDLRGAGRAVVERMGLMYQAPPGLNASMRPSHDPANAKAGLAFASEPVAYDRRDLDQQRKLLAERFSGAGWQCDALLEAAADADDFYFDEFAQVHMPTISNGPVTLVGDAGYCASPLSGMGTSLALVGAYVLAGELGSADSLDNDRIRLALQRYQTVLPLHRQVPGSARRHGRLCAEIGQRHCDHRTGDEMVSALAVSQRRREDMVRDRRRDRAARLSGRACIVEHRR